MTPAAPGNKKELERLEKLPGISWIKKEKLKGRLDVNGNTWIEFTFKDYPSFKIFPKESRKKLPPVIDLLPHLALWEEDDHPRWDEVLVELRSKVASFLGGEGKPGQANAERDAAAGPETLSGKGPAAGVQGDEASPSITKDLLAGMLSIARKNHPDETLFLLKEDVTGRFSEAVLPQGARGGKTMAYFIPDRLPFDPRIKGSFHSHPSGSGNFSPQDLEMFKRYPVNIIAYYPYSRADFKVYDNRGKKIKIRIS